MLEALLPLVCKNSIIIGIYIFFVCDADSFDSHLFVSISDLFIYFIFNTHSFLRSLISFFFACICFLSISIHFFVCAISCAYRISTWMNTLLWDSWRHYHFCSLLSNATNQLVSFIFLAFIRFTLNLFFFCFVLPSFFTDTFDLRNDWFECVCVCVCCARQPRTSTEPTKKERWREEEENRHNQYNPKSIIYCQSVRILQFIEYDIAWHTFNEGYCQSMHSITDGFSSFLCSLPLPRFSFWYSLDSIIQCGISIDLNAFV